MTIQVQFLMSSNPKNLLEALTKTGLPTVTVEAEYGSDVVPGSIATLAHHGPRAGQACPCSYPNNFIRDVGKIGESDLEHIQLAGGLSHIDLDTLGGCAAILGCKPDVSGFWELAEFVDVNGEHKISQSGATEENVRRYYAYAAWHEENKTFSNRDGSVSEVTTKVLEALKIIDRIAKDDPELLKAGDEYKANEAKLNAETFIESRDGVGLRVSSQFVNHLYVTPDGALLKAVVTYKPQVGGITISFADAPKGKNAIQILKELFGEEAGGHAGIAGSPRGKRMSFVDFAAAYQSTIEAVK